MKASFFSQLFQRLASRSPKFFRIIQYALSGLTGLSLLVVYLHGKKLLNFSNPDLEAGILSICDDLWKFTAGGAVVAATSTTNPKLISNEVKENVIMHEMGEETKP